MRVFGAGSEIPEETHAGSPDLLAAAARIEANAPFFFRHEMMSFMDYKPDIDALGAVRSRLFPSMGVESVDAIYGL